MATSRSLILSVFLSGLVFSAATIPLVVLSSRPITVEIEEKPLLTGRIQDLASPYLGLVVGLSAGIGLTALSLSEWRNTSRKLNRMRDRVSTLEHQLLQQENQVESLKFSESRLQSQGLNFFLGTADAALPPASRPAVSSLPAEEAHHSDRHSDRQEPVPYPVEDLVTALKQLTNQVEQLKSAGLNRDSMGHSINSSANASARA